MSVPSLEQVRVLDDAADRCEAIGDRMGTTVLRHAAGQMLAGWLSGQVGQPTTLAIVYHDQTWRETPLALLTGDRVTVAPWHLLSDWAQGDQP